MEPEHSSSSEPAAKTPEKRRRFKFSDWISIGLSVFIMVPALYRLATEAPRWPDVIFVSVGVGLIIFHSVRVIRFHTR